MAVSRLCLVREVQRHPVSGALRHIDFYEVADDQYITVIVPVEPVGTAKGIKLAIHEERAKLAQKKKRRAAAARRASAAPSPPGHRAAPSAPSARCSSPLSQLPQAEAAEGERDTPVGV